VQLLVRDCTSVVTHGGTPLSYLEKVMLRPPALGRGAVARGSTQVPTRAMRESLCAPLTGRPTVGNYLVVLSFRGRAEESRAALRMTPPRSPPGSPVVFVAAVPRGSHQFPLADGRIDQTTRPDQSRCL